MGKFAVLHKDLFRAKALQCSRSFRFHNEESCHRYIMNHYIMGTEVCELLVRISKEYFGKFAHFILDNGPISKCELFEQG